MGVGDVVSAFEAVYPFSGCFKWTKGTIGTCGNGFGDVYKFLCLMLSVNVACHLRNLGVMGWCLVTPHIHKISKHILCFSSKCTFRQSPSITQACVRFVVVGCWPPRSHPIVVSGTKGAFRNVVLSGQFSYATLVIEDPKKIQPIE